jgi:hypothetical protein
MPKVKQQADSSMLKPAYLYGVNLGLKEQSPWKLLDENEPNRLGNVKVFREKSIHDTVAKIITTFHSKNHHGT